MKKLFLLFLFSSSPLLAGQKSSFLENPKLNAEFEQNYFEHKHGNFVTLKSESFTGTGTNDSACTGCIGEYTSAYAVVNFPTSNQFGDLASISLTAGDWDVSAMMDVVWVAGTVTGANLGISATSGNSGTGLLEGDNFNLSFGPTSAESSNTLVIPSYRVSLAATTTYYMKYRATYNSTAPVGAGRISARRMR